MNENAFYALDDLGNRIPFAVRRKGSRLFLTLPKESFSSVNALRVLGDFSEARAGEDGYYVLPRNDRMNGDIQVFFLERPDTVYAYQHPIMAWYGIKTARQTAMVRFERNYQPAIEVNLRGGVYHVCLLYDFTERDVAYDDIRLEIVLFGEDAGYADMAKTERETRLARREIRDLHEKCKAPAVEYARKYPLIRIRMGWKPSPATVLFQTRENEPEMFVACDFARVRELADALKAAGVEGAELQLVGWNRSGHDGRYPEIFPADPRLGGDEGLRQTIDHVKSLGYRISLHTNLIDSYPIAESFTFDQLVVRRDGSVHPTKARFSAGVAYHVCPICQNAINRRVLPKLKSLGLDGVHYIDVVSISEPDCCFSVRHPSDTANGWREKHKALSETRKCMGGISSEGCLDGTLYDLDFGLYVCFGDGFGHVDIPICDTVLPLYELTYHSVLLYNPTSTTVNYPIKTPADRLMFVMRGGRPSFYVYSKFRTGGQANWMGETDLTTRTDADLAKTVESVRAASVEYAQLSDLQLVPMRNYTVQSDGIEIAEYENGIRLIGNFNETEQIFAGEKIPPFGYLVKK